MTPRQKDREVTVPGPIHPPVDVSELSQDAVDALPGTVFGALVRSLRVPDPDPVPEFESSLGRAEKPGEELRP